MNMHSLAAYNSKDPGFDTNTGVIKPEVSPSLEENFSNYLLPQLSNVPKNSTFIPVSSLVRHGNTYSPSASAGYQFPTNNEGTKILTQDGVEHLNSLIKETSKQLSTGEIQNSKVLEEPLIAAIAISDFGRTPINSHNSSKKTIYPVDADVVAVANRPFYLNSTLLPKGLAVKKQGKSWQVATFDVGPQLGTIENGKITRAENYPYHAISEPEKKR